MEAIVRNNDDRIDELEAEIMNLQPIDCPVTHHFTKDTYVRQVFMPAGSLITSKIHLTEHPYFILQGTAHVKIDEGEWEILTAPYVGITKAGTRRVLFIESDCVWCTSHVLQKEGETVEEIEERIIEKHENLLINKKELLTIK